MVKKKGNGLDQPTLDLAIARLAASGLTLDDAKALGICVLTSQETAALGYEALPALLFQYHGVDGTPRPPSEFHRIRVLSPPSSGGFGAQLAKPLRYLQPAGSLNSVYLPRHPVGPPWVTVAADPSIPVIITEGEMKAACGCRRGLVVVGLGGVDLFTALKRGVDLLPPLDEFNWRGRLVYILFDSDSQDGLKATVAAAATRLMDRLMRAGAIPSLVLLPGAADRKVGLDDYLVAHPTLTSLQISEDLLRMNSVPFAPAVQLLEFVSRYGFIKRLGRYVEHEPADCVFHAMDRSTLRAIARCAEITMTRKRSTRVKDEGWKSLPAQVEVPIEDALLVCPSSTIYRDIVYKPGFPREVEENYNLWSGWACEYEGPRARRALPDPATREYWLGEVRWAFDQIFSDESVTREFAEHWFFHPIKFPGAKLYTTLLIVSSAQGIGKSFVIEMFNRYVYGDTIPGPVHGATIEGPQLDGSFNDFLFAKSFLQGEEITSERSMFQRYDIVKALVTRATHSINLKNVPQFTLENHLNFATSANDLSWLVPDEDRRTFIVTPHNFSRVDVSARWNRLADACRAGIVGPCLLWYARERYAERAFDPRSKAPMSDAKHSMISMSADPVREYLKDLIGRTHELGRTAATVYELNQHYCKATGEDPKLTRRLYSIGRHLLALGCRQYRNGLLVWAKEGDSRERRRVWSLADHATNLAMPVDVMERILARPLVSEKVVPIAKGRKY